MRVFRPPQLIRGPGIWQLADTEVAVVRLTRPFTSTLSRQWQLVPLLPCSDWCEWLNQQDLKRARFATRAEAIRTLLAYLESDLLEPA